MSDQDQGMIEMPSGDICWFDYSGDNHHYYNHNPKTGKRSRRATGVTTILKPLDYDKERLVAWAAKTQCVGVADYIELRLANDPACLHNVLELLRDPDAAEAELKRHKLTYEDVRNRKGDQGTRVHKHAFEVLAHGGSFPNIKGLTSEAEVGKAKAVQKFFFDHRPTYRLVEQVVYSARLGVAGRLDGLGVLGVECGRKTCACHLFKPDEEHVLDVKTGGFISAAAHGQVGGAYPKLLAEAGFIDNLDDDGKPVPPRGLILHVFENGTYNLMLAVGSPSDFEATAITYRAAGRINGAASKARKAIREEVAV